MRGKWTEPQTLTALCRGNTVKLFSLFLSVTFALSLSSHAQSATKEPKTSMEWFQRTSDRMSLRMPGSSPFHMKVTFHAFPGKEFLSKREAPQIVTGDGLYEETWIAPHQWRRELSLAEYHAVEVESEKGRKMQASSEHEPSRVHMLLAALLAPIPRNFISREFRHEGASGWTIDHLSKNDLTLVRISKAEGANGYFTDAFYFLPNGSLLSRNKDGLVTNWNDDAVFAGVEFAKHIQLMAGESELLAAEVAVEVAEKPDPAIFDLATEPAPPGMTLRPLQDFEIRREELLSSGPVWQIADNSAFSAFGVYDRSGRFREVELIEGVNLGGERELQQLMSDFRKSRWRPPQIDGNPCEFASEFDYVKFIRQSGMTN